MLQLKVQFRERLKLHKKLMVYLSAQLRLHLRVR